MGDNGYANVIDVVLKDTDITTSVNYASFIQSHRIEIHIDMPTPLQWNGFRHWDFKFTPKKPTIFLLRDHIYLLQDTVKDWTSGPPSDLLHFTPMTYQLQFNLENPTIFLCVNEHNVINNPNSIEDNGKRGVLLWTESPANRTYYTQPFSNCRPIDWHSMSFCRSLNSSQTPQPSSSL